MSESEIKGHPIWTQVKQMQELEQHLNFSKPDIFSNEHFRFAKDKIFACSKIIRSMLESTPSELISLNGLQQISSQFQFCLNEASNFVANSNAVHLVNAASHFDSSVMPILWAFFPKVADASSIQQNEVISQIRESSQKIIQALNDQKNSLEA